MDIFPDAVSALLSGRTVTFATLVEFDFMSGTSRFWMGPGDLRAGGHIWNGIGQLLSIEGLEQPIGDIAPMTTFTLSGVDQNLVNVVFAASDEAKGRDVTVFLQFFDDNLAKLDDPVAIYTGIMDVMAYEVSGPSRATISVTAENLFVRGAQAMAGGLLDQRWLFPEDRGLEHVPKIPKKSANWPIIKQPDKW